LLYTQCDFFVTSLSPEKALLNLRFGFAKAFFSSAPQPSSRHNSAAAHTRQVHYEVLLQLLHYHLVVIATQLRPSPGIDSLYSHQIPNLFKPKK
jgi:hypothetical protein